jgi:YD repeat-containing protein
VIDANHWNLKGPVRSMLSELAERDLAASTWAAPRYATYAVFDEAGRVLQLDHRVGTNPVSRTVFVYDAGGRPLRSDAGPAGGQAEATTTWTYDDRGRVIAMALVTAGGVETIRESSTYDERGRQTKRAAFNFPHRIDSYSVEGTEFGYGAPGAVAQTTRYDEAGRPIESEFLDASDRVIRRVTMSRDARGHVVTEESHAPAALQFPRDAAMSDDDFAQLQTLLAAAGSESMRVTYEYDEAGRILARAHQWGLLGGERVIYVYDDHDNPVANVTTSVHREMTSDAGGTLQAKDEKTQTSEVRFSYVYDARGNWIEKIVSSRITDSGDFADQNVERRTIEYYE